MKPGSRSEKLELIDNSTALDAYLLMYSNPKNPGTADSK